MTIFREHRGPEQALSRQVRQAWWVAAFSLTQEEGEKKPSGKMEDGEMSQMVDSRACQRRNPQELGLAHWTLVQDSETAVTRGFRCRLDGSESEIGKLLSYCFPSCRSCSESGGNREDFNITNSPKSSSVWPGRSGVFHPGGGYEMWRCFGMRFLPGRFDLVVGISITWMCRINTPVMVACVRYWSDRNMSL